MKSDTFMGRHDRAIGEARQQLEHSMQDKDDGPEMEMISITFSEKDPISKLPIKEPVKNSVTFWQLLVRGAYFALTLTILAPNFDSYCSFAKLLDQLSFRFSMCLNRLYFLRFVGTFTTGNRLHSSLIIASRDANSANVPSDPAQISSRWTWHEWRTSLNFSITSGKPPLLANEDINENPIRRL